MNKNIYVSVPSLPPMEEFVSILNSAWDNKILTHNGPLLQELEKKVAKFINHNNVVAVTNGTIALQLAIKALDLHGEIITTPFTWIATASAIRWENCDPVFVDIDLDTFNIDPNKIEDAITHRTTAIMPVHVFSNPCDIEAIEGIAKKHNLKVIYDAAHAFGVNYKNKSIMEYGDISCTSFHATKIFNSGEGGACFSNDFALVEKLKRLRFFGHDDNKNIVEDGCNGKMTEIHAALGLANLPYLTDVIKRRKEIYQLYFNELNEMKKIRFQKFNPNAYNYSYMPLVFSSENVLLTIEKKLKENNIYPRRYFYPSLNTLKSIKSIIPLEKSEELAKHILCVPSNNWISNDDVKKITNIIKENCK